MTFACQVLLSLLVFVKLNECVDPLVDGPEEARRLGRALNLSSETVTDMTNRFAITSRVYCNFSHEFTKEELTNVSDCHPLTRLDIHKMCRQEFFRKEFNMTGQCPQENRVKVCSMKLSQRRHMEKEIMNCISTRLTQSNETLNSRSTTLSSVHTHDSDEHSDDDHDHKEINMTEEETRLYVLKKLLDMLDCYESILIFKMRS